MRNSVIIIYCRRNCVVRFSSCNVSWILWIYFRIVVNAGCRWLCKFIKCGSAGCWFSVYWLGMPGTAPYPLMIWRSLPGNYTCVVDLPSTMFKMIMEAINGLIAINKILNKMKWISGETYVCSRWSFSASLYKRGDLMLRNRCTWRSRHLIARTTLSGRWNYTTARFVDRRSRGNITVPIVEC